MADFTSNSAILTTIRPRTVLTATPDPDLQMRKMADFGRKSAICSHGATIPPRDQRPFIWSWFLTLRAESHRRIVPP